MVHHFKYNLKILFRSKSLIFWTFAFPILLGLFFNMAFSDIENSEKLSVIDIAIINNEKFTKNVILKESFKELSNGDNRLFDIKYVSEDEAKELLNNEEITGYLLVDDSTHIVVKSSGINETILKNVTEEVLETSEIIEKLSHNEIENMIKSGKVVNYDSIYNKVSEMIKNVDANIVDNSSTNLSYTLIEFYTLIAMACLYGGILGMTSINKSLPNMSSNGKRIAISKVSKFKLILSSIFASYIVQIVGIALLFVFTIFVLNINYGSNIGLIILLSLVGSLAGLSIGVVVSTLLKSSEDAKVGVIIAVTMLGCFLSGMMGISMKYLIDTKVPILNMINPASMITDGFYSLYYYDTFNRFYFDVISLIIFSIIMFIISFISLRRQKYDSI